MAIVWRQRWWVMAAPNPNQKGDRKTGSNLFGNHVPFLWPFLLDSNAIHLRGGHRESVSASASVSVWILHNINHNQWQATRRSLILFVVRSVLCHFVPGKATHSVSGRNAFCWEFWLWDLSNCEIIIACSSPTIIGDHYHYHYGD